MEKKLIFRRHLNNQILKSYYYIFILSTLSFAIGSCIPTRLGKVNEISTGEIKKGDSVIYVAPVFAFATFGNSITGSKWDKPTKLQIDWENTWDSLQRVVTNEYLNAKHHQLAFDRRSYKVRPFKFKVLLGNTTEVKSDSLSWLLSKYTWLIRLGLQDSAKAFLPDSIAALSYTKPVLIISNDFYFYEKSFFSGYAEGSTGLNVIPAMNIAIISKENVIYFRTYRKRFKYMKIKDDPQQIMNIHRKLFDKI